MRGENGTEGQQDDDPGSHHRHLVAQEAAKRGPPESVRFPILKREGEGL